MLASGYFKQDQVDGYKHISHCMNTSSAFLNIPGMKKHIKPSIDAPNFYHAKCAQGLLQVPSMSGGEASSNFCYRSRKHANFTTTAQNCKCDHNDATIRSQTARVHTAATAFTIFANNEEQSFVECS